MNIGIPRSGFLIIPVLYGMPLLLHHTLPPLPLGGGGGVLFFYYDRHSVCLSSPGIFPKNDIEYGLHPLIPFLCLCVWCDLCFFPQNNNDDFILYDLSIG